MVDAEPVPEGGADEAALVHDSEVSASGVACRLGVGDGWVHEFRTSDTFDVDVSRLLEGGAGAPSPTAARRGGITQRWQAHTQVLASSESESVLAVRFRGYHVQHDARGGPATRQPSRERFSVEGPPILVRLSSGCAVRAMARRSDASRALTSRQQAAFVVVGFEHPAASGSHPGGAFIDPTGRFTPLVRHPEPNLLLARNLGYSSLHSGEEAEEVRIAQSLIRIELGARGWFSSLGFRPLRRRAGRTGGRSAAAPPEL